MNTVQSFVLRWSTRLMEYTWLVIVFFIPNYFNLLSSRHFEPDKALSLRAAVTFMITLAVIDALNRMTTPKPPSETPPMSWWQRLTAYPLWASIAVFIGVQVFATLTSVVPTVSFWGSYQRLQGTYTMLSYVVLSLLIVRYMNTNEQRTRFLVMMVLGAIMPTLYGYVQHLELDPLPWKGDVITRVASTMGNSIFIAAYLILIVPIALSLGIQQLRHQDDTEATSNSSQASWNWLGVYAAQIIAIVALQFAAMQFSGVIRAVDLRFWWVYPGAIFGSILLSIPFLWPAHRHSTAGVVRWVPAIYSTIYTLLVVMTGQSGEGVQFALPTDGRFGAQWSTWLWGATLLSWMGAVFASRAPQLTSTPPLLRRVAGWALIGSAIGMLVTIFFSQSRGPWIGGGVGLFVFTTLSLRDTLIHHTTKATRAKRWLIGQFIAFASIAVFLIVFNFADIPALRSLKDTPYIGRMGRLFDVSAGTTGDVRMKIWFGDDYGSGAIGLITADPVRTLIGWGPESMFVAYNPFYPPSLANVESRSASPDRSHQALLDEIINKGLLGLLSYLAVIGIVLWRGFVLLRTHPDQSTRLTVIALMSAIIAHSVEGLTGIPIVSTLLILWLSVGLIAVIDLQHQRHADAAPATTPEAAPAQTTIPATRRGGGNRRTAVPGKRTAPNSATSANGLWVGYLTLFLIGCAAVWSFNIDTMYADMRFQQGQSYSDSANTTGNVDQQTIALSYFIEAARLESNQDFYYLNMGRSLLSLAETRRRQAPQAQNTLSQANLNALIQQPDAIAVQSFLAPLSARDITLYAEAALQRAQRINPLNKDHFANMARLYNFWYTRIEADPAIEQNVLNWYREGVARAPQDVSILNEYIGALITYANQNRINDSAAASEALAQAETLLLRSQTLDARFKNTAVRQADLLWAKGNTAEAVTQYSMLIADNPRVLDTQISTIITALTDQPALLQQLLTAYQSNLTDNDVISRSIIGLIASRIGDYATAVDAFAQLAVLQPDSLETQQNYTLVLSEAQRYTEASLQVDKLIDIATRSGQAQSTIDSYVQLREFFLARQTP